jgi:predicted secreted protein
MRKYLYVFVLMLLISVFMVNCTGNSGNMVYTDPSKTIEIESGKQFDIKLEGNATTGYEWEPSFDQNYIKLVNKEYKVESDPGRVGAPGEQYFTFQALKQGTTEITIVYKRSWEEGSADKKVFKVNIK